MVPREGRPDIVLLIVTLILVTVGTVMIYSSSSILATERFNDGQYFLKKQIFFVIFGIALMVLLPGAGIANAFFCGTLLKCFVRDVSGLASSADLERFKRLVSGQMVAALVQLGIGGGDQPGQGLFYETEGRYCLCRDGTYPGGGWR